MISDQRYLPSQIWSNSLTIWKLNLIQQTVQISLLLISTSRKLLTKFPTNDFPKNIQKLVFNTIASSNKELHRTADKIRQSQWSNIKWTTSTERGPIRTLARPSLLLCLHKGLARHHNVKYFRLCRKLQSQWRKSSYIEHRRETIL